MTDLLREAALDAPALFSELDAKADAMVSFLEKKGLRSGDRLAVFLPASWHFLALLFASSKPARSAY
jgi:acyl-CoA synthetase (AMP-forming)/AMP-acid ligase II